MEWARFPITFAAAALALFLAAPLSGQEYHVDLSKENGVVFLSDAPLEDFEGKTERIDGFVYLEGEGLGGATDLELSEFYFEVDLASLDTGLALRNRHMRDRYLETDAFPFASFSGRVVALTQGGGGEFSALAQGELSIHGVARSRQIECAVKRTESGTPAGLGAPGLQVRCDFPVTLSDHDIPIPKLMFMKIDEVMELSLDLYLVQATWPEDA